MVWLSIWCQSYSITVSKHKMGDQMRVVFIFEISLDFSNRYIIFHLSACFTIVVVFWRMLRILNIQTNCRKHGPPTLGSYTRLTLPDKIATKMQTKRPINKLEKADILIIIWKHIQPISSQIMGNNQAQKFYIYYHNGQQWIRIRTRILSFIF